MEEDPIGRQNTENEDKEGRHSCSRATTAEWEPDTSRKPSPLARPVPALRQELGNKHDAKHSSIGWQS
eukprot:5161704-Amphidinium_carterae.1